MSVERLDPGQDGVSILSITTLDGGFGLNEDIEMSANYRPGGRVPWMAASKSVSAGTHSGERH